MVTLTALWLPILLSAVFVFVVSSIIHMLLGYHKSDFNKVPQEDELMDAMRPFNIPPGDYVVPRAATSEEMKAPEYKEKAEKGPVLLMTVYPNGVPGMGASLILWFLYSILISIFAAYIAGRALTAEADYLEVFRFAGTVAFGGYALGQLPQSIWYKKSWSATFKNVFDSLIYALVTAGTFGWLWP